MARLARRHRVAKILKKKSKGEEKKRTFSRRVRFEREVLKAAKHGPQRNSLLEIARSRRSMLAHLAGGDIRLSPRAVHVAVDVAVSLMSRVAQRASLLLHYAGKRCAGENTIRLAISDVMAQCSYLGVDLATMPQFVYRPGLPVFVHSKGRATAEKLAAQFDAQVVA